MSGKIRLGLAAAWLGAMALLALFAPLLSAHHPLQPIAPPLQAPAAGLPMGADALGRDVWSRLVFGARITLAGW